jgi:4-hydroxy-2-oxoglutarate aldolase
LQNSKQEKRSSPTAAFLTQLRGILLPFPTPFTEGGEPDLRALRANLERWNETGITGYAGLGSTGERVNLEEREYLEVIEIARDAVPADLAFIVGAGQQSTRVTIAEVQRVASAGADAVLVITPSFYRSAITQEALIKHYTAIADASPVPVILYSMPALTGIKIEPETIAELSTHPNIIGVKDSSNDIDKFRQMVELVRAASTDPGADDFAVLTGNGTVLYPALQAGATGGILAVGCVAPRRCVEIFEAFQSGDYDRASALQEPLTPLAQAVTTKYGIGGLKAALDMIGYAGGSVRAPLQSPTGEARSEIGRLLNEVLSSATAYSTESANA